MSVQPQVAVDRVVVVPGWVVLAVVLTVVAVVAAVVLLVRRRGR